MTPRRVGIVAALALVLEAVVLTTHWQESKRIFGSVYRTLWTYAPAIDDDAEFTDQAQRF
jgi:hypothetical protein